MRKFVVIIQKNFSVEPKIPQLNFFYTRTWTTKTTRGLHFNSELTDFDELEQNGIDAEPIEMKQTERT